MKILGLIPARGGSKGVPGKNKKLLGDKPLITYTIQSSLKCKLISETLVSTNDEEIAEISRQAGALVPFLRPPALARDDSPTIDAVIHALEFCGANNTDFEAVCLLQPTVPFRTQLDLDQIIEFFINSKYDSVISVRQVPHQFHPHWQYKLDENNLLIKHDKSVLTIKRRQDLPKTYYRDGSVYLTRSNTIKEQRNLYGHKIGHFIMTNSPAINIDGMGDWKKAEAYLRSHTIDKL